jgi:ATP-dependent Clp protease ATP-binding subunit ClpB
MFESLHRCNVTVSSGADGLLVGDRISVSNRPKPDLAVVY